MSLQSAGKQINSWILMDEASQGMARRCYISLGLRRLVAVSVPFVSPLQGCILGEAKPEVTNPSSAQPANLRPSCTQ